MTKLNSYSRNIYHNVCKSPKKLKRDLTKAESRFNLLLKDWLADLQGSGIEISQKLLNTQCGMFLEQAKRMGDAYPGAETEGPVDWDSVIESLEEVYYEWKTRLIPETRSVRVKITGMLATAKLDTSAIEAIQVALGGTYFEEYETISFTIASVERKNPISSEKFKSHEEFLSFLVREHILKHYLCEEPSPVAATVAKIKGDNWMGPIRRRIAEFKMLNLA